MKQKFGNLILKLVCITAIVTMFSNFAVKVEAEEKQEPHVIPIAMATDDNYVYPTVVSMTSILENKNSDTYINFHIMVTNVLSDENQKRLLSLQNVYNNCHVELINMKDKYISASVRSYLATPTYYRLSLPSLLPQYNKVLYLDGDTIIRKDLWSMYNIDVSDYYIGAVIDQFIIGWSNRGRQDYAKELGIKEAEQYVNAGVLLMNLEKMRNDNIEKNFDDYIPTLAKRGSLYYDQDVLNAVCYSKIKFISPEYNAMQNLLIGYGNDSINIVKNYFDLEQWKKACDNPTIIHYMGAFKPWESKNVRFYSEWDKYRQIAETNIYKVLPEGIYTICSSLDNNMVVDVSGFSKQSGANVHLWTKHGLDNQKFKLNYLGQGYYQIESVCSGKVLDVAYAKNENGANVWQHDKNGSDAQIWTIKSAGNDEYYIVSKCNNLYLDLAGAQKNNGTNIFVWSFNGNKNQKFKFVKS